MLKTGFFLFLALQNGAFLQFISVNFKMLNYRKRMHIYNGCLFLLENFRGFFPEFFFQCTKCLKLSKVNYVAYRA